MRRAAAAVVAVVGLSVTVTLSPGRAAVDPLVRVLGNQEVVLRDEAGVLSCAPGVDERRVPRMACGLVVFRAGASRGPVAGSLVVQVTDDGLRVVRYGATPREVFHTPLRDAIMRLQVSRATHGVLRFTRGRTYYFSGTRIVCELRRNARSVRCTVVGRGLVPHRPGHAFTIGFRGVEVFEVAQTGIERPVFSGRHRR